MGAGEAGVLQVWLTAASSISLVWVHRRKYVPREYATAQPLSEAIIREAWIQATQVLTSASVGPDVQRGDRGPQLSGVRT